MMFEMDQHAFESFCVPSGLVHYVFNLQNNVKVAWDNADNGKWVQCMQARARRALFAHANLPRDFLNLPYFLTQSILEYMARTVGMLQ